MTKEQNGECLRCKDWQEQGLSDTCPDCDMLEESE